MEELEKDDDLLGDLTNFFTNLSVDLPEGWQKKANCRGVNPNLFFPERGVSTSEAKAVCAGCQVKDECLEFAVDRGEKFGIWGGYSERERRKIRKARRIQTHEYTEKEAYKEKKAAG